MPDTNIADHAIQPALTDPADLVSALQATSMLAAIRIKRLGLGRADREASKEAAERHGARADATRLTVNRLAGADHYHQQLAKLQNTAREAFNAVTLAWGDGDGWRLLPNANFNRVLRDMQPITEQMRQVKAEMAANVDSIIAAAAQGVGRLNVKPPTADEILSGYSMEFVFQPLPDGSRFKGLPEATVQALTAHIISKTRASWESAQSEAMGRVAEALDHLVERLTAYQDRMERQARGEEVGRQGVFNDTLITNVAELAQLLPAFNAVNDPRLAALSERLASLCNGVDGDTLRKDQKARDQAMQQARDMLDVLAVWKAKP